VPWLITPVRSTQVVHGEQSYVCLFSPEPVTLERGDALFRQRNRLMAMLEQRGVATRQGTHAPPHLPYYADKYGYRPADFPLAWLAEHCTITLPLYAGMTEDDCTQVVAELRSAFEEVMS
jgi:perosamine synthetase